MKLHFTVLLALWALSQTVLGHSKKPLVDAKTACLAKAPFMGARGYACNGPRTYVSCDTNTSFYAQRYCKDSHLCTNVGWLTHPPCHGEKEDFPGLSDYKSLCHAYAKSDTYDGYVCPKKNTTYYLRCMSLPGVLNKVADIQLVLPCPRRTRCYNTPGEFTTKFPCSYRRPVVIDEAEGIVNNTLSLLDDEAKELCDAYTPTDAINETGYVCIDSDSSRYVQCSNVSSTIFSCASPLVCAYPVGKWVTNNTPCDYAKAESSTAASSSGTTQDSSSSSSAKSEARELCDLYTPAGETSTGFVCVSHNSSTYLECGTETAMLRECATGTVCTHPLGSWTQNDPCGYLEESSSLSESSEISEAKKKCREYMPFVPNTFLS